MFEKSIRLSALALALLAPLPGAAAENARPPPADCRVVRDPLWLERHVGKTVTVAGRFSWDIHYQMIYPESCGDVPLFVSLTGPSVDQLDRYLRAAYPGINFGGGEVWGVFTGKVVRTGRRGMAYLRVDAMTIDDSRRMRLAPGT